MASWRSDVSSAVADDFEALVDAMLPRAELHLGKRGSFLPFGAFIDVAGSRH
jgi:hypothetical protein